LDLTTKYQTNRHLFEVKLAQAHFPSKKRRRWHVLNDKTKSLLLFKLKKNMWTLSDCLLLLQTQFPSLITMETIGENIT